MSKIDVHHHVYPPVFTAALDAAGGDPSGWFVPKWTLQADKQLCQAVGVKTAILSVTAPGPTILSDPIQQAALARECNEFCAKLRDNDPVGYGYFASVPSLLDPELVIQELDYAFDTLKADGVILMTRYGEDNHYLGHAAFAPVWKYLNARKAVVLIHPTHPVDLNLVNLHLPQPMWDYPHETGRTAVDLLTSGRMSEIPDCKVILSHAGGDLPYVIYRAAGMLPHTPMTIGKTTEEILEEARSFYFDTAISSNPVTLTALYKFAKPGHVLFGTDFPNAPSESIKYFTGQLASFHLDQQQREAVEFTSAQALFPRLKE